MKNIIHVLYCLSFYAFSTASVIASNETLDNIIETPYSAELQSYNKFTPKNKYKSKVSMSKHGVKIESKGMFNDGNKGLYIQNFHSKESWIVDPKNKIFSLIIEDEQENNNNSNSRMGGIMATHPCLDAKDSEKKIEKKIPLAEDNIIVWSCSIDNKIIKQGYSQRWKIVIWEELPSGNMSKLVNIKKIEFEKGFYMPPKHYREVSLKEFYTGAPALKKYAK